MNNNVIQALQTLDTIELVSASTEKQRILYDNRYCEPLTTLLERALNPYRVYNIKKIPLVSSGEASDDFHIRLKVFLNILSQLESRSIVGNDALDTIVGFFSQCSDLEAKWYRRVIQKDPRIGMKAKSVNSVIPGLIPEFRVMLAQPFRSYPKSFLLQPKYDGMRCIVNTSTGEMFSRKGKPLIGFDAISQEVRSIFPKGLMLDGEIMIGDEFRTLMRQAFAKVDGKEGIFNVFDLVDLDSFFAGELCIEQGTRTRTLESLFKEPTENVVAVPTLGSFSSDEPGIQIKVADQYQKALALGLEGLIIKDLTGNYVGKRSYLWQKLKPEETFDCRVIDLQEGKPGSKYEGSLGALIVGFEDTPVGVGSGLTDEQRDLWWNNPELILGKIVVIKAQQITDNLKGTHSLRHPRFKEIHRDKN